MIINNSVNVLKPDMEKVPFVWYIVLMLTSQLFLLL